MVEMDSALIVSSGERGLSVLSQILRQAGVERLSTAPTAALAKQMLVENEFDLCMINSPLSDETGERLALNIASRGNSEVILCVRAEVFEEVSAHVEDAGVLTVSKPIQRALLWNTLKVAISAHRRVQRFQAENTRLIHRIEDIRMVDRAKCLLISYLGMSEEEAHRYLEKQAMDTRRSKREVAEQILKNYEG